MYYSPAFCYTFPMIPNDNEQPHRLEDVQKRLYSKNPNAIPKRRLGVLHPVGHTVSNDWTAEPTKKEAVVTLMKDASMQSSFFQKFFIAAIIFFLISAGVGFFLFLSGSNSVSADNIGINILGNAYTPGGENLPLTVELSNTNATDLQLADLIVQYGRNKPDVTDPSDITTNRIPIGIVPAGKIVDQKVDLTLYGDQGIAKNIKFTLEYHVPGSNAVFQKEKYFSVVINTAPLTLAVAADTSITANAPYTFVVNITSNVKKVTPNMLLTVNYPTGFAFQNAEPAPTYMNNVWNLGDVNPGETRQIKVVGTLNAQEGEERSFRVYTGTPSATDKNSIGTTFASTLHTVDIVRPFLQAQLAINGQQTPVVVAQSHSTINGTVTWMNNLPVTILNAQILVQLNGALIDPTTIQSDGGFYNSATNTITWDRNTLDALARVAPGAGSTLGFTFATQSLYSSGSVVSNPQVALDVSISGEQPQEGTGNQEIHSVQHTIIKLATDFQISGQASYSSGPFTNSGPLPPQVNQKTTYTIKWALTSSASDVSGVKVVGSLPGYVHFLNLVNPTTSDLKIDPLSGNIVWNAGTVSKGAGFSGDPKTVYFQVEFDPSLSQVGTAPVLVKTVTATGTDTYTTSALSASLRAATTELYNDPVFHPGDEKVVQ
jgi:hypothetical protein